MTDTRMPDKQARKYDLDNLDRPIKERLHYDDDNDFVIDSGRLRGVQVMAYDELGRVYQSSGTVRPRRVAGVGRSGDDGAPRKEVLHEEITTTTQGTVFQSPADREKA